MGKLCTECPDLEKDCRTCDIVENYWSSLPWCVVFGKSQDIGITEEKLRQIVREELVKLLNETRFEVRPVKNQRCFTYSNPATSTTYPYQSLYQGSGSSTSTVKIKESDKNKVTYL